MENSFQKGEILVIESRLEDQVYFLKIDSTLKNQKKRSVCPTYGTIFLKGENIISGHYLDNTTGERLHEKVIISEESVICKLGCSAFESHLNFEQFNRNSFMFM